MPQGPLPPHLIDLPTNPPLPPLPTCNIMQHHTTRPHNTSRTYLVLLERAPPGCDIAILTHPQLVNRGLNEVLVVRHHEHAALEGGQALDERVTRVNVLQQCVRV